MAALVPSKLAIEVMNPINASGSDGWIVQRIDFSGACGWVRLPIRAAHDCGKVVLRERIELSTSPLPRECSTTELPQPAVTE